MLLTMIGSIIGGAIAAAIGGLVALGIEIWRERKTRKNIVQELMAEIEENIKLSSEYVPGLFEVSVWKSSFTKLSFLPADLLHIIRRAYREAEKRNYFEGIREVTDKIGTQEIQNAFILCRDKLQI
jgi:hypothetical protein